MRSQPPGSASAPSPMRPRGMVTFVVPAKDEAYSIGATLQSLPLSTLHAEGYETEILVLDGNSRDATRQIARQHGARVIRDRSHGKAAALRDARTAIRGEWVVMLDADGTYAPDAIPRMLDVLHSGEADVVMGCRVVQAGAMTALHRFGNRMLSLGASLLYMRAVRDLCTGLWAFRSDVLQQLPMRSEGFDLEAEMFALCTRLGLRVATTRVDYLPRVGHSKLKTSDGIRIAACLLRTRFILLNGRNRIPAARRMRA